MRPVKHQITNQKPVRAFYNWRVENLSAKGRSDYLAMRRRLCNCLIALFVLCVGFAGVLLVLHGTGMLLLPTTVLTTLVVVVFGAVQQMLGRIVKSVFHRE
jgi:hypothetical protein